jgi:hypothetical protein
MGSVDYGWRTFSRHISQAGAAGTAALVASCGKEPIVRANSIRVDWSSFAVGQNLQLSNLLISTGFLSPDFSPMKNPG